MIKRKRSERNQQQQQDPAAVKVSESQLEKIGDRTTKKAEKFLSL